MGMKMKESNIERYLHDQIDKAGGTTRKFTSPGNAGVPDRICFYKSSIFFVEVKALGGKLSKVQRRQFPKLEKHGAKIFIVECFRDVDILVKRIKENVKTN